MENYVKNVKLMDILEYKEINELINNLDSFLMDEKPVVKIFDDHHLNEMKSSEKIKVLKKKTPSITYEENQRVRWEKGGKYNYGEVIKDKGKRVVIKPDEGGKVLVEKKYIEIVEEGNQNQKKKLKKKK